jgi:sugar lactone lactonase YvrE
MVFVARLLAVVAACAGFVHGALAQSFYVGFGSGQILLIRPDGSSTPFGSVTHAEGMAVDDVGNLFVADSTDNVIYKFTVTATGTGARSIFASGFAGVSDIALDSVGNVYAADTNNDQVVRYAPGGASLGVYASGTAGPEALTFDQNDFLFVACSATGNIQQVPPGGGTGTVFAPATPSIVTLTFDSTFTNLYEGGGGTIRVFDRAGNGSVYTTNITTPGDMTFDLDGNFYVLDSGTGTIQKFAPNMTQTTFATFATGQPTGFVFIPPVRHRVQGNGTITTTGGVGSFQIQLAEVKSGKVKGSFGYEDSTAGVALRTSKFTMLNVMGNQAEFAGTARVNKQKVTFMVNVLDVGNLNAPDTFSIKMSNGYSAGGNVMGGNVTIK